MISTLFKDIYCNSIHGISGVVRNGISENSNYNRTNCNV